MLNSGLVETLIDRKILNQTTRILAEFEKTDNSLRKLKLKDLFYIEKVERDKTGTLFLKLCRIETKERFTLPLENILEIDGMEPKVLAKAFGLSINGSKSISGKRRGRPRKHFPYGQDAD